MSSRYTRTVVLLILLVVLATLGCQGQEAPGAPTPAVETASPNARHLIYLHGKIIEDEGPRPTHPVFGTYEYQEILDTFTAAGFQVSSDLRPAGTPPVDAAKTTAQQVRRLLDDGVAPDDITVVGFSKGGAIAVLTALELDRPTINYVFIACCGPWIRDLFRTPNDSIRGRMLSIFETSDRVGSCSALFAHAAPDAVTAELETDIGGGHGAFYRPHPEWVDPVIRWARGDDLDASPPSD